jgi:hypothetical protein
VTASHPVATDRHRIHVLAPTVADVVAFIGGWVFDQAMRGWDVHVFVAGSPDVRPLQILGACPGDLDGYLAGEHPVPPEHLAVATEIYDHDTRVRGVALAALRNRTSVVALWGRAAPAGLARSIRGERIPMSAAAAAFKAQAVWALGSALPAAGPCRDGELLFTTPIGQLGEVR